VALAADWARLAAEQRALRAQMESHFRSAFPDAVAVADPGLQMRRQLAAARHAASQADEGDFLVMSAKLAAGLNGLPAGAVRVVSYESGRLTLELAITEEALLRRVAARLLQAGLTLEAAPVASGSRRDTVILTVRTS